MEQDPEHNLPLQVNLDEGVASEIDDQTLTNLIMQDVETIVLTTDIDRTERARIISYYVRAKYEEFVQTGRARKPEEAIKKQHLVLEITSRDDEGFGKELDLLGVSLKLKYERFGEENNLQEAIEKAEKAVRVTLTDHPDLAGRLYNIGNKLERRYGRTGKMADHEIAIEKAEEVVRVTPIGHPNLAGYLNNLGRRQMLCL